MSQSTDATEHVDQVDRAATVRFLMSNFKTWMDDKQITEIVVNRPGEVFCERDGSGWEHHLVPELNYRVLESLAIAVAKYVNQDINAERPILSAVLPDFERVQFVVPPACEHGTIAITIRKPSHTRRTLQDYKAQGFFDRIKPKANELTPDEERLLQLKIDGSYMEFLELAVQLQKVIIVAGETGSGKTTFMKALMEAIEPTQRLITIEDVPELFLPNHPNHVHLFYPSEASEEENSPVTSAKLLKSCLRMKPDRILLAELRGGETFDFVNIAASGHGGSISSLHAGSPDLAFERMALMVLQNRQGRTLPYDVIRRLLYLVVDVVIHVHNEVHGPDLGRHITELWYDPYARRNQQGTS